MYQCGICLEHPVDKITLNCGHYYCSQCIKVWQKRKNTCPYCRTPFYVDVEPEGYLYIEQGEYDIYSRIDSRGEEKIIIHKKNSHWRGDKYTFEVVRPKRIRKKIKKNRKMEKEDY